MGSINKVLQLDKIIVSTCCRHKSRSAMFLPLRIAIRNTEV